MSEAKKEREGVISRGIKTPIIQKGDDLQEIVISSVAKANDGQFDDGDIIAVTEAVVAISQGNFVTHKNISDDIERKFPGATEIVLVDPIQSRNRFLDILKAISAVPALKRIYIAMSYPTDEVGNRLVSDMSIMTKGINPYQKIYTKKQFYYEFGEPKHPFTGKNYIQEYIDACGGEYTGNPEEDGKATVILCNDFSKLPSITKCENFLVCSIHRRHYTRRALKRGGAKHVLDMSQIMNQPIDGSDCGFNEEFGIYGSNLMAGDRLKLMPRDCQTFVEEIQEKIKKRYGKKVEVMVYGDGAFKDPVGGIWELADPKTTLGFTDGLLGTPKEVKLKYIASANEGKSSEEIEVIVAEEISKRKSIEDITSESSLGTTPRPITDLVASLADLTTGSGARQTPVVYIKNYL